MRALLQRVTQARVERVGPTPEPAGIGVGLVALVGVTRGDSAALAAALADDIRHLRVFDDEDGRMALAVGDVGGGVLVVPQITLYADTERGRRPSFDAAAPPDVASGLIDRLVARLREAGLRVATGHFGAHMRLSLVNDGPVTILLEA